ncbi:MAG: cache domain-containing protein [Colwellia sp.]|nr:cache domain-containing protein [Colwellia sp.]
MNLPLKLLYIAIFQVILTSIAVFFFFSSEYRQLSSQSLHSVENFLLEQKKRELKNYTALAVSSVEHLFAGEKNIDPQAQANVVSLLNNLLYNGEDGYFFVYSSDGVNIAHPKESFRVGENWWDLEDNKGEKIVQILIKKAQAGGGFHRYKWSKPSTDAKVDKIGYSVFLDKWQWMLGTGVYLDDVNQQVSELQQEIDQHINKTQKIVLSVALGSIFILFIVGLIFTLRQKQRSDIKINELGQRIISLQEEERRHISRELHDGIVQMLVSIKYSIEATSIFLSQLKQEKPKSQLAAEKNLSIAIQEIRRISHHLHPRILDELGLSAAMDALSSEFSELTGIKMQVITPKLKKLLPDNISTTLYRVVQESLTNIQKHAKASNVVIELVINQAWLTLTICDNGKGFDTSVSIENQTNLDEFGIGLRNLAERIEYHSGIFKVTSTEKGTKVSAKIPKSCFANYFNQVTSEKSND